MKLLLGVSIALLSASPVIAQVTQTYQYDANGRLTGVTTTGSGGTNTATYDYDDADNRTSRSQTGATAWASILQLPADQALVSADGHFSFALRPTGRLELWREDDPVWTLEDLAGAPRFAVTDAGARMTLKGEPAFEAPLWPVSNDGALIATAGTGAATVWSPAADMH